MSGEPQHYQDPSETLEEADEAFIDLEDPNLDVVDDGENDGSLNSDDNDASDNESGANEGGNGSSAAGQGDGADDGPEQDGEVEDLNAIPDHEPERDDSCATFTETEPKPFHAVATSPSLPRIVAASGEDEKITILEYDAHKPGEFSVVATLEGHTDTISLLSFSPNGELLASGSLDSTVCLWRTSDWSRLHVLSDLYGEIMTLLWHPSSLVLVAGAEDAQAAMWNVNKGTLSMYFVGHRGPVTACVWSPDFKKLITGSSDGSVIVFSPKTGEQEFSVTKDLSNDNAGVTSLCFVSDDLCIVGCEDGTVHAVSLRAAKAVNTLEEVHEQAVETIKCNANSTLFFTTSCDCRVVVWNCNDLSKRHIFSAGESVIPGVWVHTHLIAAGCSDGCVRIWDGRSANIEPFITFMGHRRMILDVCSNGNFFFTASDDGSVKVFEFDAKQYPSLT